MSNNKQNHIGEANKMVSSVEWFAIQLWEEMNMQGDGAVFNKLLEQAKAMHKEETLKLYYEYEDYVLREEGIIKTFGQFYNETYGGNK